MSWIFKPLASLRLTLVLLTFSLALVFLGTMAQEPLGLYIAQDRFFQSAFVDLASMTAALKKTLQMVQIHLPPSTASDVLNAPYIPVFPGGYLLGSLLLVNLLAAHITRFQISRKKVGIVLVHGGIILLLVGQLFTDVLSRETAMRLAEGETKNYSESDRRTELAVIDGSAADRDRVVAIPDSLLQTGASVTHPELPFQLKVVRYYPNSFLTNRDDVADAPKVSAGLATQFAPVELPRVTDLNSRDVPSAVVEVTSPEGSLGSFLLSEHLLRPQSFEVKGKRYDMNLRLRRHYRDFSLTLLDFRHDKYKGTEIPKNYSSQVRLRNPSTGEDREVKIYMNTPLRYQGLTFYQASFIGENTTILQVVRNPAWLTPYLACLIVGLGLVVQFGIHLFGFVRKQAQAGAQSIKPSASA
ncbi:MAG: cytochrome c biogenesis protein ResB [Limisphaerales bacterium]